jgi:hypothetical protein
MERLQKRLTPEKVAFFEEKGYVILEDIFEKSTTEGLRDGMKEIVESFDYNKLFNIDSLLSKDMSKYHKHFAESSYEIYPFVEAGSFNEKGELVVPKF